MRPTHPSRLWLLPLVLALAAGCNRGDHPRQIGKAAPDFSIRDGGLGGGRSLSLSEYRGKVVVLNFWASWCAPCVEEIPSLNALASRMPRLVILGVSTDKDAAAYQQFVADHKIAYLTIRDPSQRSNTRFGTYRFPETYVIDRQGRIRRKFIGPQDWTNPEILAFLSSLLAAPKPPGTRRAAGAPVAWGKVTSGKMPAALLAIISP